MPLTEEERRVQEVRIAQVQFNEMQRRVDELITYAESNGFVVTIDTEPLQPLAMRNYKMVANVRRAR